MDSFENSPDTTQPVSEQTEVSPTTEPTSTPVPVSTTPPADTTPKSTSKKNYLEIGILFVIIAILAGLVTWYFVSKNQTITVPQESDTTDQAIAETTVQPTQLEVTPTMEPRDVKVIANCTLWDVTQSGPLVSIKENELLCENTYPDVLVNNELFLNTFNELNEGKVILLNLDNLSFEEKLATNNLHFLYHDRLANNFYTMQYDPESKDSIYSGTLENLKNKLLLSYTYTTVGRGIGIEDFSDFKPNKDATKIIYTSTIRDGFLPSTPENVGAIVLSNTGNVLIEVPNGITANWIDNDSLILLIIDYEDNSATLRKYTFASDNTFQFVDLLKIREKSSFGSIYKLDVYGNTALMSTLKESGHITYTIDLSRDDSNLVKLDLTSAKNYIINQNLILGYKVVPCEGEYNDGGEFSCPLDSPFSEYRTELVTYNIQTKEQKTILVLDEPMLL